jgi:hypothetical protein
MVRSLAELLYSLRDGTDITYEQYETECPHCGKTSCGGFPGTHNGKFPYGANVKVLKVLEYGMIGMGWVRDLFE